MSLRTFACLNKFLSAWALSAAASSMALAGPISDAKLFYPGSIAAFPTVEFKTPVNHPDYFEASVERQGCTGTAAYGLRAKSTTLYGTEIVEFCLDLETGALSRTAVASSTPKPANARTVIAAPAQGGDYFEYQRQLRDIARVTQLIGLEETSTYIAKVSRDVSSLEHIDQLDGQTSSRYGHLVGKPFVFKVGYKTSTTRLIKVAYQRDDQTLSSGEISVPAGEGLAELALTVPAGISLLGSFQVQAQLVDEREQVRFERNYPIDPPEAVDQIYNTYVSEGGGLQAGKTVKVYLNWRADGDKSIIVRLVAGDGLVYGESRFDTKAFGDHARIDFTPAESAPAGTYTLVSRMVPVGASWEQADAEFLNRAQPVQSK